jgi:endonuclease/exonuclease/phosphatase family metal-dependent hydrolase
MPESEGTIRAMTWNVWWRFGGNWRERQDGIVAVLQDADPDIVGLQECWGDGDTHQAEMLAWSLGRESAFVRVGLPPEPDPVEEADQEGVVMGLGLLSRWPITKVAAEPMPSAGRELAALVAEIRHPRGAMRVVVGATSWEPDRRDETASQIRRLEWLTSDGDGELPSLLLADLNYDEELPAIADLRLRDGWDAAEPGADPRTLSSTNRFAPAEAVGQYDRRIDHVRFTRGRVGARAVAARVVRDEPNGLPPSDHYPVVVDIAVAHRPPREEEERSTP